MPIVSGGSVSTLVFAARTSEPASAELSSRLAPGMLCRRDRKGSLNSDWLAFYPRR